MSALGAAATIAGSAAEVEHGKTKLRGLEAQLTLQKEIFEMKADLMRNLIHALIDRRIDAVRQGFLETLATYAEQCRHYMAQQDKYADAEIKVTAPLERANIRARLSEIDIHLTNIRSEAAALYREMNRVILLIGGSMPTMSGDDQHALAIIT